MLAALRRMFGAFSEDELYRRASREDRTFFESLSVPMVARALIEGQTKLVMLSRRDRVADLDCDHAIVILASPKPRVFGTELGTDVMSGTPTHFLVELDPYSTGLDGRLGNFGDVEIPADAEGAAQALMRAALGAMTT